MSQVQAWISPADYKPRWKIEKEEKVENQWLEAGLYQFACESCGARNNRKLRAVKTFRQGARCDACNHYNAF